ncbi:MAG: 2,5-dihydroxypyridine 5,6-dioxygenase [Alphaproteobacteria bacterium MarineAlpha4_Bin2]|nr:MAG: 2,5-dihydroxypyridine 5,6-dioxygenase [Alphaproteobacteria bacterium MarineAlpha4_Bin2]
MLADRIEAKWIDAFRRVFEFCQVGKGETVAILSETQSRSLNVNLAELALQSLGARIFHIIMPTPRQSAPVPVRSTGASDALQGLDPAIAALSTSRLVVDLTVEGLLHAPELPAILKGGARVLMISNEHPEALERLAPDASLKDVVRAALARCRETRTMTVTSTAGTNLTIDLENSPAAGVWGWTDRPGTIAHWPGGIVVAFPKRHSVNGHLVMSPGDINLTFKRYLETPVALKIEDDYVTAIEGDGLDAALMREYFEAWDDHEAYGVSHVGWGLNPHARYEALTMYDQRDTNGTELRALAGSFLFSTGANEFADRHTLGHFDLPMLGCNIALDGDPVVENGKLVR